MPIFSLRSYSLDMWFLLILRGRRCNKIIHGFRLRNLEHELGSYGGRDRAVGGEVEIVVVAHCSVGAVGALVVVAVAAGHDGGGAGIIRRIVDVVQKSGGDIGEAPEQFVSCRARRNPRRV